MIGRKARFLLVSKLKKKGGSQNFHLHTLRSAKNMLIDMLAIPRNGSASGIPEKKGFT